MSNDSQYKIVLCISPNLRVQSRDQSPAFTTCGPLEDKNGTEDTTRAITYTSDAVTKPR